MNELIDQTPPNQMLIKEVLEGLSDKHKHLPAKLLYDERGSDLFEKICHLDAYYPTRIEAQILKEHVKEIAECIGENSIVIEPGSGASEKIQIIFKEMKGPKRYIPMEISKETLIRTSNELRRRVEGLEVYPVCTDFTLGLKLPEELQMLSGRKVVFFPGSTIGNLDQFEVRDFLVQARVLVGRGGGLIIGVDTKKDPSVLYRAYNDPDGVTAEFNLNILSHLNREFGTSFDPKMFKHEAVYNAELGRVEMHLQSLANQKINLNRDVISFEEGETIHTENSYKYSVDEFNELAVYAGLVPVRSWQDHSDYFSIYYFEVP